MKEIGCSTMLYRNFSLKQALAGIQQAGGSAIELCARSSVTGQITHLDLNRHDDVNDYYQKVKQTITNHNLLIESIAVSNQQIAQPAELERLIEASHQLGTDTVVISSGGVSNSEESFLLFVDKINQASTILTGSQIRLSVKPRVGRAVHDVATAEQLMTKVDANWVGLNFDATHIYRSHPHADPVQALAELQPHIFTVRIRDHQVSREPKVGPVETQIPGNGGLDLVGLASIIKQMPNVSAAILEIVGTHKRPEMTFNTIQEMVTTSISYLKPLLWEYVATPMTTII